MRLEDDREDEGEVCKVYCTLEKPSEGNAH